jgi:hypothetical protein
MVGSDSTHAHSGSKGIITGSFKVVDYVENLLKSYDSVVMDALNQFAAGEQATLRSAAMDSKSGWRDIANNINVAYNHESRQIAYTVSGGDDVQNKAMNLEYGNGALPPTPLLRNHTLKGQYDSEMKINNQMNSNFMKGF